MLDVKTNSDSVLPLSISDLLMYEQLSIEGLEASISAGVFWIAH